MDVRDSLTSAEQMLVDNKRAGAVQELIDVCRFQQLCIDELDDAVRDLRKWVTYVSETADLTVGG